MYLCFGFNGTKVRLNVQNIEGGLVPVSYGSLQQVLILCNNNQIAKELLILLYCCHNFILLILRAKIR